ncbi:class I SAM-dependent methyltransferase [Paracoccus litorisediminis]|uniref:class I SAM-dependent methyltransferase n=1 Tax=Paracoccus litorisediminis TaxID=2006130 RepID=UPI003731E905
MVHAHSPFADPAKISSYAENARRNVPGLADLHCMVTLLLAERVPQAAHLLVVGAGGGIETAAMALSQPSWRFTGVDPSPAMLDLARQETQTYADRINLIEGRVNDLPQDRYDGATCLLTFHHLARDERLHVLREIHSRLNHGGPLVVVEHTAIGQDPARWMCLSAAFRDREGPDWEKAFEAGAAMTRHLSLMTPAETEALLRDAGFGEMELFYAALSFRGWIARAS